MRAADRIEQLDQPERRHVVELAGLQVVWRCFGDRNSRATPLALLHGGHGSWLHWLRNVEALSKDRAVWVADLPGFGESDDVANMGDFSELVALTRHSLDALIGAQTPVHLAGFSFGALAAAELAAMRAQVITLALLGPAGHGTERRMPEELVNWRRARSQEELEEMQRHNLSLLMLYKAESINADDQLALEIHLRACEATRFYSKAFSRSANLQETLDQCHMPTLLLWGEHDLTAIPDALAAALCGGHANRRSHIIADAGHWVQFEAADETNAALSQLMAHKPQG